MANVILTNVCNLSCPYCFAGALRSLDRKFISRETFDRAAAFLLKSHSNEIGLIGGEPTLHPEFGDILRKSADLFGRVFVYTNGVYLEHFFPDALRDNICYLVNVNSSQVIGKKYFYRIEHMLDTAAQSDMIAQFALGVNVYEPDQNFDDVLHLCETLGMNGLRLSVVVPDNAGEERRNWFLRLKPALMRLYGELSRRNIVPKYDCNIVPPCVFTQQELDFIRTLPGNSSDIARLTGEMAVCRPVVDIYPDLTVARCFGMSRYRNHHIDEFNSLDDIIRFFLYEIDGRLLYADSDKQCQECYRRKTLQCSGGCLTFLGGKDICTDSGS